jgi:Putative Actinobacterial Holin-X, holin superfamily III
MVAQTPVNTTNGSGTSPQHGVAHNTGELLADALTLAELQSKLLVVDVQDDLRKLIAPLAVLITGAVVGLSCLPVALVTIALGLVAGAGLAPWLAFLISLGIGAAVAAGLVLGGVFYLKRGLTFLERSRTEWEQNVRWFKSLVRRLGSSSNRSVHPGK